MMSGMVIETMISVYITIDPIAPKMTTIFQADNESPFDLLSALDG